MQNVDKDSNKVLLATLAGIGVGVMAGVLLAPKNGQQARDEVMRSLNKASDEVNGTLKRWTADLKARTDKKQRAGATASQDDELVLHGSWDDVKRQLRQNYDQLTEEDLSYEQGRESELLTRLQTRLGKTKDEVLRLLSQRG